MQLFYDYQVFLIQKYGGASRYFYEIIKRMKERNEIAVQVKAILSQNYYLNEGNRLFIFPNIRYVRGIIRILKHKINQCAAQNHLSKNSYDIIHPTYYHPYILKCKGAAKLVLTVHDMIHEIFDIDDGTIPQKEMLARAADKIIAVSECTKKDILHWYPDIPAEKIVVIYHGANIKNHNIAITNCDRFNKKYILYVGARYDYKNFIHFIKAVKMVMDKHKDIYLLCAGGGSFSESEKALIYELQIENHVSRYNLDDHELAYAYQHAVCFVFPSLYEGFGIPVLEAFENGCAVALSNTSSLPEVGGNAALYFDPLNIADIANQIIKLMEDDAKRNELIAAGKKRLAEFSWDKAAEQTFAVYEEVLKGH